MKSWILVTLAGVSALSCTSIALAGTNSWTSVGPWVSDVKVAYSSSPDIVYARGGDSVWRSDDAGANWQLIVERNTSYYPFAVSPDPALFFVGSSYYWGVIRSDDSGESFETAWLSDFYAMAFGATADVAYGVSSLGNAAQILRSTNRGQSWADQFAVGLPSSSTPGPLPIPYVLGVDQVNADVVYAGFRHADYQGIYRSLDHGATWTAGTGLMGVSVNQIVPHPTVSGTALVATSAGLFRSADSGATWTRVPDPGTTGVATVEMQSAAYDRTNASMIYAGGALRGQIFFSSDGGANWSRRDTGVLANRINSLATRPGHPGELLAGTSHTMYRSTDSGQTWTVSATGIRAGEVTSLQNGSRLRVGLADGGVYESEDGLAWTPLGNAALRTRLGGRFSAINGMTESSRLLVMPAEFPVVASTTQGATWQALPAGYPNNNMVYSYTLLTVNGVDATHLASTNHGIYRSTNDGFFWGQVGAGLPANGMLSFAQNADGSVIFGGLHTMGVYRSTNRGGTWTAVNQGLPNLEIKKLAYDEINDVLLVGTNNGLFVSRDSGATYTELPNPWPAAQMSVDGLLVEDFDHGAIYVGFQKLVYRSVDQGQTWTELLENNPYHTGWTRITALIGDGPGKLYLGNAWAGLKTYTVSPDVRVSSVAPAIGVYAVGADVPWQFTARNHGPHAATFARASWQVPATVEVRELAATRGACSVSSGNLLTCDFGILAVDQAATVSMVLRGVAEGEANVELTVGSAETDPDSTNNLASHTGVRFVTPVDVSVALTGTPASVAQGAAATLTATVSNVATVSANEVVATLTLSDRLAYTSATGATCTASGATVTCNLGTLAPGAAVAIAINVTASSAGTAANTVSVTSAGVDPVATNNSASFQATVNAPPAPAPAPTPPGGGGGGGGGGGALDAATASWLAALIGWAWLARRRRSLAMAR